MMNVLRLQVSNPTVCCISEGNGAVAVSGRRLNIRLLPARRHFASFTVQSAGKAAAEPSVSSQFASAVGSSPVLNPYHYQWSLNYRHIRFLSFIACAAAISATWLFCSAIPTLLAFKRAAESLEKLMDETREELPETMARTVITVPLLAKIARSTREVIVKCRAILLLIFTLIRYSRMLLTYFTSRVKA